MVGKTLCVLPESQRIQPLRNRLHCRHLRSASHPITTDTISGSSLEGTSRPFGEIAVPAVPGSTDADVADQLASAGPTVTVPPAPPPEPGQVPAGSGYGLPSRPGPSAVPVYGISRRSLGRPARPYQWCSVADPALR